jgi:hypothetical protein
MYRKYSVSKIVYGKYSVTQQEREKIKVTDVAKIVNGV